MRIDQLNPNHPSNVEVMNLVGGWYTWIYLTLWKMMEWKSVGMMKFPTEWKIVKFMLPPTRLDWNHMIKVDLDQHWWLNMIQQHILTNIGNVWFSYLRSPKFNQTTTRHICCPSFDQRRKRHHRAESRKLTSPWSQCQPHVLPWPWPDLGVPWNLALDS